VPEQPNPCRYSPEVIDVLRALIRRGERIHDPFAGSGERLGRLCDEVGAVYTGTDVEHWAVGHDRRVGLADALDAASYPAGPFTIVTSPVYLNKRCADYANGPTPRTKTKGRRDYGIALGHALHLNNLARFTGRPSRARRYREGHSEAVKQWGDRVIVNVDEPIAEGWQQLLREHGYLIDRVIPAYTRRYGGLDNADKRAEYEVVIVAYRAPGQ
jgi:hypothetical protein